MDEMNEVDQSWYTKYRPKTMEEYSGKTIKNIIAKRFSKKSNMPHVIMIHGSRGCGKTTFCRIISKYYLCENPNEDGTPCEQCEMCESINEILIGGNNSEVECPGVVELDATTMGSKEAIQDILSDALQAPIYSQYKVLIIDECHRVSQAAQNSMLKIIEDIPKHLIVMFATTEPQKVLQTIKSRCQLTLEARKQSLEDMTARLEIISRTEGLTVSKEALEIIVRKGDRVPRECINILEDVAKTYDGEITLDHVREHLGGVSNDLYIEYFESANTSLSSILVFIKKLRDNDVKLNEFVSGLMKFALDSMYVKFGISLNEYPADYVKKVKQLFEMYDSNEFDMLLQVFEYLSNRLTEEDEAKNELLLTTTAMRISKIELIANGLAQEQETAVIENKESLLEHSKKLKANNSKIVEKLKMDLSIENLRQDMEEVVQVVDTSELLENVKIPEVALDADQEKENKPEQSEEGLSKDVLDFLNNMSV